MTDWDKRYLDLATNIASWSKDRSTGTGAIIVDDHKDIVSIGYNGFPKGSDDDVDARHERPAKYMYTEHAERNAIYNAARKGVSTNNCTMYLMWFPCADCARGIIQSGIKRLVCYQPDMDNANWCDHFIVAKELLEESDVELTYVEK
tara:strand:+ start:126 stop:566 length:441 start_codon:yes stop_codon:yes gene_type:complete